MGTAIVLNGTSYTIPAQGEGNWGTNVTNYLVAIATGVLTKAGGAFTLTAEADFGATYGLKSTYFKSRNTPSTTGVFRLGNDESVAWRNQANGADLPLKVNTSNILEFNGNPLLTLALGSANTALRMNGAGTAYEWSKLVNANIDDAAAVAWSKISKAGSNLTDMETRSHTSLSDIGTNSHAQIDTALSTSASHQSNTSNPHSVTAAQVGLGNVDNTSNATERAASATLTNKTIVTPVIDDYLDINEESAPGTPAAGKVRVYAKTDKKIYRKDSTGVEQEVGSGSGTGVASFFSDDFESGSIGSWVTYKDAAAATPVDGTGGSPTVITASVSSSSPLNGTYSLNLAKSASNGQGEGASVAVAAPSGYQQSASRVISFLWDGSDASYVAGDMVCYIYNVTNATLITPSVTSLPAAKVPIELSWDSTTSASYRLIFHIATTNASAYTVKIDDVIVGPGKIVNAPVSGPIISYTPTVTIITPSNVTGFYQRDNDTLILSGRFTVSSGGVGSPITFSLPTGLTIDSNKLHGAIGSGSNTVGFGYNNIGATDNRSFIVFPASTTAVSFLDTDEGGGVIDGNDPGAGNVLSFTARIPIAEWAGTPNYAGSNDRNYISDDGSNDVFGTSGSLVPNVAVGTGASRNITITGNQATDDYTVEYNTGNGNWSPVENYYPYIRQGAKSYGVRGYWSSATIFVVEFGDGGVIPNNASYAGNSSGSWAAEFSAGARFRLVQGKSGAASGFGEASIDRLGLIKPSHSANAGSQAAYSSSSNLVRSGTYTPSASALLNLDSNPTVSANSMIWSQVGRVVTCSGYVEVNPTTINTASTFTLTLPVIPTSNFASGLEAMGLSMFQTSGAGSAGEVGTVTATTSAKTVTVGFFATDTSSSRNFFYQFQYQVN